MGRLTKAETSAIQADRLGAARRLVQETGACVVLKGARTVIAGPSGAAAINLTGNPGMASGGMGDVLAGMIGSLCGQGLGAEEAAVVGVHLHGLAADLAVETQGGRIGLIASDVIATLPRAIGVTHAAALEAHMSVRRQPSPKHRPRRGGPA